MLPNGGYAEAEVGEKVIYRVALQILQMKKRELKKMNKIERIVEELKNFGDLLESDIDSFFDSMYEINLSRD
jgi:phosphoglucomutase